MTLRVVPYRQKQHRTSRVTASKNLSTATISSGAKQTAQQQLHISPVIADKYWFVCSDTVPALSAPWNQSTGLLAILPWTCPGEEDCSWLAWGQPALMEELAELQVFQAWSSLERVPAGFAKCPAAEGQACFRLWIFSSQPVYSSPVSPKTWRGC